MPFTNEGLENVGSWIIGLAPISLGSIAIGIDGTPFVGTRDYLGGEVLRKIVTWTWGDYNIVKGTIDINQAEANGSYLQEIGYCGGSIVGSDLSTRELSAIGSKNSSFLVNIVSEIRITRK